MTEPDNILLANAAATLFLVGLIWTIQIVHYPLFENVGTEDYLVYQTRHQNNITFVVGPVMLIELLTAILLIWYPTDGVGKIMIYIGIGLVAVIWLSTALIQVPCHQILASRFDAVVHKWLVHSNWIRTIAWSTRGGIVIWMLSRAMTRQ